MQFRKETEAAKYESSKKTEYKLQQNEENELN